MNRITFSCFILLLFCFPKTILSKPIDISSTIQQIEKSSEYKNIKIDVKKNREAIKDINDNYIEILKEQSFLKKESIEMLKNNEKVFSLESQINEIKNKGDRQLIYYSVIIIFALMTLAWNIYIFLYQRKKKKFEIADEYWHQKIMLPICLDPLTSFVEDRCSELRKINSNNKDDSNAREIYTNFLNEFQEEKSEIIRRFYVLSDYSSDAYDVVSEKLDELDDVVTKHCAIKALGGDVSLNEKYNEYIVAEEYFYKNLGEILIKMRHIHSSNI